MSVLKTDLSVQALQVSAMNYKDIAALCPWDLKLSLDFFVPVPSSEGFPPNLGEGHLSL